jgi:hypothetical protein
LESGKDDKAQGSILIELHYVKVPENHIVIDFDLKDINGHEGSGTKS